MGQYNYFFLDTLNNFSVEDWEKLFLTAKEKTYINTKVLLEENVVQPEKYSYLELFIPISKYSILELPVKIQKEIWQQHLVLNKGMTDLPCMGFGSKNDVEHQNLMADLFYSSWKYGEINWCTFCVGTLGGLVNSMPKNLDNNIPFFQRIIDLSKTDEVWKDYLKELFFPTLKEKVYWFSEKSKNNMIYFSLEEEKDELLNKNERVEKEVNKDML